MSPKDETLSMTITKAAGGGFIVVTNTGQTIARSTWGEIVDFLTGWWETPLVHAYTADEDIPEDLPRIMKRGVPEDETNS
jgi:hypothetical protein